MSYMDDVASIEREREHRVRGVACTTCEAGPGEKCVVVGYPSLWSHIDRYQRAVELDLVPPLRFGAEND